MKKFFDTPKKAIISTLCITAVVLGAAVAVPAIILNTALIGKNDAEKAALNDAGLTASQVSGLHSELDYDDGSFRYEVDFYSNGTEYEYLILAKDGDIISRDTDGQPIANGATKNDDSYKQTSDNNSKVEDTASETQIREAVTELANVPVVEAVDVPAGKADETTVNKPVRETVGNTEIEFYCGAEEYEYSIDATSGEVIEFTSERD